jgi:parallel beta-helix repeat protein
MGAGSIIKGCTASQTFRLGSASIGIQSADGCVISDCAANGNGGMGIQTGNSCLIRDCSVTGNTSNGILCGVVCKVTDCVVSSSGGYGIYVGDHAQVTCCHVNGNGSGIIAQNFSIIRDNMVDFHGSAGISINGSRNRIEANNITRCGFGIYVVGTSNLVVRNSTSGNSTNYSIPSVNADAETLFPGHGFVSTDPWANFSY